MRVANTEYGISRQAKIVKFPFPYKSKTRFCLNNKNYIHRFLYPKQALANMAYI